MFLAIIEVASAYCKENNGNLLRIIPSMSAADSLFRHKTKKLGFGLTPGMFTLLSCQNNRYNIRLSQRRGVMVREGRLSDLPVFHAMITKSGQRDGFSAKPMEFYSDYLCAIEGYATLLLVEKGGAILSGAVEVFMERKSSMSTAVPLRKDGRI